jgi:hypothetical protein
VGSGIAVTSGIISGLHRQIPGSASTGAPLVDLIQTDAAISPGNSGGAVLDGQGDVVGMSVAYIPWPPARYRWDSRSPPKPSSRLQTNCWPPGPPATPTSVFNLAH